MARRTREATADDEMDELERAEASILERQKKDKGKKDKGKGREKPSSSSSRRESRNNNNASESEAEDESEDGGAAATGAGGKSQLSSSDITERARDLVRLAICNEVSRRPLRREEINKKVLHTATRNFQKVYDEANLMLESVWGMELVPLFPNELEDINPEADKKKKSKKKKGKNGEASATDDDEEDAEAEGGAKNVKRRGPPRMFCLRTLLDSSIIKKAVRSNDDLAPEVQERYNEDLRGALGDAVAGERGDEELKEWKKGDDAIFDWKSGPDQRTLMGILYVILSLIMVNERVLTDEQLQNHLKRLDLRFETRLPLNPAAMRPEKQTLATFLQALIRQQYLERTTLSSGPASKNKPSGTQAATQLQRVRATQATQQQNPEEGLSGDPNSEWRWGPRAFKEFGEDGVASFIKDFYRSHYRGQQTRGNDENQKDGKTLLTEIAKGATGNKPDTGLIPARE